MCLTPQNCIAQTIIPSFSWVLSEIAIFNGVIKVYWQSIGPD